MLLAEIEDGTSSARTGFDSLRSLRTSKPELLSDPTFDVYMDGGIKRGSDVLMALALGARGVGLGRAFLWAQTAYGEKGVIRSIRSESGTSRNDSSHRDLTHYLKSWRARSSWRCGC